MITYKEPTKEKLETLVYNYLSHRSAGNNRAFQGRPFAFEALVDYPEDLDSFEGLCRGIKRYIDEG